MKIFGLELFGKKTETPQETPHVGSVSPPPGSPEASVPTQATEPTPTQTPTSTTGKKAA